MQRDNLPTAEGMTPLHIAAARCNKGMAEILLRGGADVSLRDNNDLIPCEVAELVAEGEGPEAAKGFKRLIALLTPDENGNAQTQRRCDNCDGPAFVKLSCPCRLVRYCGPKCQKQHWKVHKTEHKAVMSVKSN